jgi:hypothetical protein
MADKWKPRQGGEPFGVCPVSLHLFYHNFSLMHIFVVFTLCTIQDGIYVRCHHIIFFLFFTIMLFMTSYKSNDFSSHLMISIHGMSQSIYIIINFHSVSSVSEQQ